MSRSKKLEMALRRNRGQNILYSWAGRLSAAARREVLPEQFLSLERTDELRGDFSKTLTSSERVTRCNVSRRQFPDFRINDDLDLAQVLLFSSVDRYIGAVQMMAGSILRNAPSVWEVVEEDLRLSTFDVQSGLCLEVNFYDIEGRYIRDGIYEISGWGTFAELIHALH